MNESERYESMAKLIELGFWGADERGDPTDSYQDAMTLHDRVSAKIVKGVFVISTWVGTDSLFRQARVVCGQVVYELAYADNYPESIALPEFLKQHPECAADQ